MYCQINNCDKSMSHTTMGHRCESCKLLGHSYQECGNIRAINRLKILYVIDELPEYLQCEIDNCRAKLTHSTLEHYNIFRYEKPHPIKPIPKKKYLVNCPNCRKENEISHTQMTIYGIEQKCSLCEEGNVEVYLPKCGHSNICWACLRRLAKK